MKETLLFRQAAMMRPAMSEVWTAKRTMGQQRRCPLNAKDSTKAGKLREIGTPVFVGPGRGSTAFAFLDEGRRP